MNKFKKPCADSYVNSFDVTVEKLVKLEKRKDILRHRLYGLVDNMEDESILYTGKYWGVHDCICAMDDVQAELEDLMAMETGYEYRNNAV